MPPLQISESTAVAKYGMNIYWSEPGHCLLTEVPELAGCVADGATRQGALRNAEVIVSKWIETARELGRPIPQPRVRPSFAKWPAEPDAATRGTNVE